MADKNGRRSDRRHAWVDQTDGNYYKDNITGEIRMAEGPAVTNQPKSSHSSRTSEKINPPNLRKCWEDPDYLYKMVIFDFDSYNLELPEDFDATWKTLQQTKDLEKLRRVIQKSINSNIEDFQKIFDHCLDLRRNGILIGLQLPEVVVVKDKWTSMFITQNKSEGKLKRMIEVLLIVRWQLQEAEEELQHYLRHFQRRKSSSDESTEEALATGFESSHQAEKVSALETENIHLKEELAMTERAKKDLENELRETRLATSRNSEEDATQAKEIQSLQLENNHLKERLAMTERAKADLENQLKESGLASSPYNVKNITPLYNENLRSENDKLKKQLREMEKEKNKLEETLRAKKKRIEDLFTANFKHAQKISEFDDRCDVLQQENINLKKEYDIIKRREIEAQNQVHQYSQYYTYYQQLWNENQILEKRYKEEFRKLRTETKCREEELERRKFEIVELQKQASILRKSKEDLLTRLSKVAGGKLTHGNAEITDLSDENRPTKIAEKFSELYDNEWTDALEELADLTSSEETAIRINLRIISDAYRFCSNVSEEYAKKLLQSLTHLPLLQAEQLKDKETSSVPVKISPEVHKEIEEIRKTLAPQLTLVATERFLGFIERELKICLSRTSSGKTNEIPAMKGSNITGAENLQDDHFENTFSQENVAGGYTRTAAVNKGTVQSESGFSGYDTGSSTDGAEETKVANGESIFLKMPSTKLFAEKCANLCWLMRIRDPKVHMIYKFDRGIDFNTDEFRHYTRTGKKFDYLVWPALYLHENGPLLAKAVAQPIT